MATDLINIGNKSIGLGHPPFIIAEMSGNHNQSFEKALAIVDAAAEAGVDALKLQTYTADTMTIDVTSGAFYIDQPDSPWKDTSLYNLYRQAYTSWEWHKPIFERCKQRGMLCFSSPFDESAVDFLESLDVPAYKIASFENVHLPLIRKVARTGKPVILSTGMASIAEIDEAVRAFKEAGGKSLILLKCTSTYPSSPENSNITTIPHMRQLFNVEVGLSDHTLGIGVSVAAVALGASVLEKHFTLNRAEGGVDSAFSMEPGEMKMLVDESLRAWQAKGRVTYGAVGSEVNSLQFRRSIYCVKDVKAGEALTPEHIRIIRPGGGLPPKYYDAVLGMRVACSVARGTPLDWSFFR